LTQILKINTKVNGLDKLQEYIDFVDKFANSKFDVEFQKELQDKCLEVIQRVTDALLPYTGDTVELYKSNNKIREFEEGFIIYNDTVVEATSDGYDGEFSIALAFEYGTGIVGQESPKEGAWEYNVNQHDKGWIYFKNEAFHFTRGLQGFEIYRESKRIIQESLYDWVTTYYGKR